MTFHARSAFPSAIALMLLILVVAAGCRWTRDAAGTIAEIEGLYPGSRVEIDDRTDGGTRKVAITIVDAEIGHDADLAERAEDVATIIRRQYELGSPGDTVAVTFRAESRDGPVITRQGARFVYAAEDIAR